jgi:arginyl-tRNA synthetase
LKKISNSNNINLLQISNKMPDGWETTTLERLIARFPEVVERAGGEYAPHYIATYLTELASAFNGFYASNKIADENDPTSGYKIALTSAFATVIKNGLNLLGIKVPDQM